MTARRVRSLRALVASLGVAMLALAVAGCLSVSTQPGDVTSTSSSISIAQATHEYPSPPPPRETASGAAAAATAAIEQFTNSYINWTADTVSAQMRALADHSIGQARSAMQLAAAETAQDYELQRGGIANSGSVEAVAPLFGRHDEYVVVTRELTTATNTTAYQGLAPAWHLAIATVTQLAPGQWVVSGWQPEN